MSDSAFTTVVKCIGAAVGACVIGAISKLLLLKVFAWSMDLSFVEYGLIGSILLPLVTIIPAGGSILLSMLFRNHIAIILFCAIVSIWMLVTTIEFWGISSDFTCNEWIMASGITILMAVDIVVLFLYPFTKESK